MNNSVEGVDYVIPGNDDAIRSIKLYVESAADSVDLGKLTVAHAVADSADEFVELDESGASKAVKKKTRAAASKKPASKVTVKKKAAPKQAKAETSEEPAETAADEAGAAAPDEAQAAAE